jgi:hypothetical protein
MHAYIKTRWRVWEGGWEGGWRDIQPIVLTSEGSPLGKILCVDLHCTFEREKKRKKEKEITREKEEDVSVL